jgi:hypothetical protein
VYKLQTFGIPADTIPVDENGNLNVAHHKCILEKRRDEERQRVLTEMANSNAVGVLSDKKKKPNTQISVPASCDILLGRGKGYFNHVGNVRYRSIIEEHKERYDRATKEKRQGIAEGIVDMVYNDYGGRFLKDDGGVWIQIDDKTARHKVGHSFRALRSASKKSNATAAAPTSKRILRD